VRRGTFDEEPLRVSAPDAALPQREEDPPDVAVVREVNALAAEWDDLALRTDAPPFVRPGWIDTWWSAFGHGQLHILTLRREGDLVTILPLARHRGLLHSCSNVHARSSTAFRWIARGVLTLLAVAWIRVGA
jgi:CelD/BcsL family acetyltransferase involved in cellulose biosynthesis